MVHELTQALRGPEMEGFLRILLAGGLGGLMGLQREIEGKPAGIRTYGLVAIGAATFTAAGMLAFGGGDPASRVAAQIITGIGFLGAGTILHMRDRVLGLTTAAGLWVSAAVGMAVGGGLYLIGIGTAVAVFLTLQFVRPEVLVKLGVASQEDVIGKVPKEEEEK